MTNYQDSILMVGPAFDKPRGGIAMCLYNLNQYVFAGKMNFIANSTSGSTLKKVLIMLIALCALFFRLLFNRQLRLVHIHAASSNSFRRAAYFVRLSRWMGRKVILHIHGGAFDVYYNLGDNARMINAIFAKTDALVALTESWKDYYKNTIGYQNPVYVLPNIVPPPEHCDIENDGRLHYLFLGRIDVKKGVLDLLQAVDYVADTLHGKAVVHMAGSGPDEDKVDDFIRSNGLSDLVIREGWVSGDKKAMLLSQCRVMLSPSYAEALGINNLEAMSYGMAVIAYNVGGIPTIVKDGVNGILVTCKDVRALSEAMARVVDDAELLSRFGAASLQMVKPYLADSVKSTLTDIYAAELTGVAS